MTWCADEFGEANFGDARLTKRFIGISQSVLDRPGASLSAACGDWAGAKGAYRFFDNEKVTPEEMLRPHVMKVKSRSSGRNVVLAVQDSTYLNLDSFRCMQGLGFVEGSGTWAHKGLVFHPSLAFSTEGECLGLLGYKLFSRSETRVSGRHDYMLKPIHEKESFRWIQALEKNVDAIPKNCDVVTIGDRESDIYELFDTADKLNSFYLVRGSIDRYVYNEEYPGRREGTISDLTSEPIAKKIFDLELQATNGRKARTASVEVSYFQTKLKPPQRRSKARVGELGPLEVSVCTVLEINPPKDENALRWILFTNHPIDSIDEACEKVNWYKQRWQIEIFFKVMKSGFGVENTRFGNVTNFEKYILMIAILSTRVMNLTYQAKNKITLPAEDFFTDEEMLALKLMAPKAKIANQRDAAIAVASLGGFLNRKNDGPPGPKTMWIGLTRLAETANLLKRLL